MGLDKKHQNRPEAQSGQGKFLQPKYRLQLTGHDGAKTALWRRSPKKQVPQTEDTVSLQKAEAADMNTRKNPQQRGEDISQTNQLR